MSSVASLSRCSLQFSAHGPLRASWRISRRVVRLCADQIETSTSPPGQTPGKPRANPGHLTIFCARGVGNLTGKAFLGVGNLTFAWVGWGKLNLKCQVSNRFFFWASLTAINTCLDEMEEFKGRDIAFVSDWLTRKGLQKLCSIFEGIFEK